MSCAVAAIPGDDWVILTASVGHTPETRKPVGDDERAWRNDALGQRLDALSLEAGDAANLEAWLESISIRPSSMN